MYSEARKIKTSKNWQDILEENFMSGQYEKGPTRYSAGKKMKGYVCMFSHLKGNLYEPPKVRLSSTHTSHLPISRISHTRLRIIATVKDDCRRIGRDFIATIKLIKQ